MAEESRKESDCGNKETVKALERGIFAGKIYSILRSLVELQDEIVYADELPIPIESAKVVCDFLNEANTKLSLAHAIFYPESLGLTREYTVRQPEDQE